MGVSAKSAFVLRSLNVLGMFTFASLVGGLFRAIKTILMKPCGHVPRPAPAKKVGIVTNDVAGAIENIVKGNFNLIERDHTVVLGWNRQLLPLINQVGINALSRTRSILSLIRPLPGGSSRSSRRSRSAAPPRIGGGGVAWLLLPLAITNKNQGGQ